MEDTGEGQPNTTTQEAQPTINSQNKRGNPDNATPLAFGTTDPDQILTTFAQQAEKSRNEGPDKDKEATTDKDKDGKEIKQLMQPHEYQILSKSLQTHILLSIGRAQKNAYTSTPILQEQLTEKRLSELRSSVETVFSKYSTPQNQAEFDEIMQAVAEELPEDITAQIGLGSLTANIKKFAKQQEGREALLPSIIESIGLMSPSPIIAELNKQGGEKKIMQEMREITNMYDIPPQQRNEILIKYKQALEYIQRLKNSSIVTPDQLQGAFDALQISNYTHSNELLSKITSGYAEYFTAMTQSSASLSPEAQSWVQEIFPNLSETLHSGIMKVQQTKETQEKKQERIEKTKNTAKTFGILAIIIFATLVLSGLEQGQA